MVHLLEEVRAALHGLTVKWKESKGGFTSTLSGLTQAHISEMSSDTTFTDSKEEQRTNLLSGSVHHQSSQHNPRGSSPGEKKNRKQHFDHFMSETGKEF